MGVYRTMWRTQNGRRRTVRLYQVWNNLLGRLRGHSTKQPSCWADTQNEFLDWSHFRAWALANNYRKGVELDRIEIPGPYAPWNCQWLTKQQHVVKTNAHHRGACLCSVCRPLLPRAINHDGEYTPF